MDVTRQATYYGRAVPPEVCVERGFRDLRHLTSRDSCAAPLSPVGPSPVPAIGSISVVGGGGQFRAVTIRKTFVCADGSGTFIIQFHPQFTNATTAGCEHPVPSP
jgi:hypothetical protein